MYNFLQLNKDRVNVDSQDESKEFKFTTKEYLKYLFLGSYEKRSLNEIQYSIVVLNDENLKLQKRIREIEEHIASIE